jgi:uncharacterized protein YdhG (YjbR/CyaY superfamily)
MGAKYVNWKRYRNRIEIIPQDAIYDTIVTMSVIDDFIAKFTPAQIAELERIRRIVHETVPEAEEAIVYGMSGFRYKTQYLVAFCAFKNHLSLFPAAAPIDAFAEQLQDYKLSKGTIQFTLERTLPEELIRGIVLKRVGDIEGKN